jgi:hypothetical protein
MSDDDDDLVRQLRDMLKGDLSTTHRLQILKELRRVTPPDEPEPEPPKDPMTVMTAVVERHCPRYEIDEVDDSAPDPHRDLIAASTHWPGGYPKAKGQAYVPDPLLWTWLPYTPADVRKAEREVLSAARRLGIERGPYEFEPLDDELARRRKR